MSSPIFRSLTGLFIFGLISTSAIAAECDSPITSEEALKAEDARYLIQANNDFDGMQRVFGDDLVYIHSTGFADDKASYIERQRANLHYRSVIRENAAVRVFGCVAIITGSANVDVTFKGADLALHLMFHSVWAKRGADLRFVSWESTTIPKKQ